METQLASATDRPGFLKPGWTRVLAPPWVASLVVLAVIAAIRFYAVLSPYPLQVLFFVQAVAMWVLPLVMLTAQGRREVGLTVQGMTPVSLLLSALAGVACGLVLFGLGMETYGNSADNWCISIRNYLRFEDMRGLLPPLGVFALYALPAVCMNPIGEEIFFRGFLHRAFTRRFNPTFATLVSSVLFGLMYLAVHGFWRDGSGIHLRFASTALALILMACIGAVFTLCRTLSGSLWPAMAAHAAFNLTLLGATIHEFFP